MSVGELEGEPEKGLEMTMSRIDAFSTATKRETVPAKKAQLMQDVLIMCVASEAL